MPLAALFAVPSLLLVLVAIALVQLQSPARLLAWIVAPQVLGTLLALNVAILAWRLIAVGQAFLDTSRNGPTGRLGVIGIVVVALLVVLPHLVVYRYGTILGDTFGRIFQGAGFADDPGVPAGPVPGDGERINVLLVGVDKLPNRTATLTDTMMVASLDPVGKTVSLLSVPRDLIDTPLPDGNVFGPKLNSLLGYADSHKDQFPKGGIRTLEDAIGALLGIPIHYYARIDFVGFIDMVDAVGGVDVTVAKGFQDPGYDGFGFGKRGWSITEGPASSRRTQCACLRAVAQGRRRERLHPGSPPAADPGRPARQGDERREPSVPASRAARRGGTDDPFGRTGRQAAGAGRDHGGGLEAQRGERRHPLSRWSTPSRLATATRRSPTCQRSGRWRRTCSLHRARRPRAGRRRSSSRDGQTSGGVRQRSVGGAQASNRSSNTSRSASTWSSRR